MIIKILGIDPGTSKLGWAMLHYDTDSGNIRVKKTGLLQPTREISKVKHVEMYSKRVMSLWYIRTHIEEIYNKYKPHVVASEDSFFNRFRPNSFAALLQVISTIAMMLKYLCKPLYKFAPKTVKMVMGSGGFDKDDMIQSLKDSDKITIKNIDNISEHEIDAVCVGYTYIQQVLPNLTKEQLDLITK
jgi:Holliday junction resolvasome RuvABC endonuclease subunit